MYFLCDIVLSVSCSFVVTCLEWADLFALLFVTFCCVSTNCQMVSCVGCSTRLCRFLIFAFFLTLDIFLVYSAPIVDPYCYWLSCLSLLCWYVCSLQPSEHLLEMGWPLGSSVCCVFLTMCFVSTCWKWADLLALLCVVFSWQCVLWSPAGNGLTTWLFCVLCFLDNVFCDHLLEMGWPLGSFVCCVILTICFCHFPLWCPGSDVVLDCFDSWSLRSPPLCRWKSKAVTWDLKQCGMCDKQSLRLACVCSLIRAFAIRSNILRLLSFSCNHVILIGAF